MTEPYSKYIIEGLDRLGKSTLVEGIKNTLGFFDVIHYQKPQALDFYNGELEAYQRTSFMNMFALLYSDANLILDRAHLGEMVYAPIYRKYSGDYVLEYERFLTANKLDDVLLVLLTEDFSTASHFVDDGESFDIARRQEEQSKFMHAFDASILPNKVEVCVTDPLTGAFKSKDLILKEVLSA